MAKGLGFSRRPPEEEEEDVATEMLAPPSPPQPSRGEPRRPDPHVPIHQLPDFDPTDEKQRPPDWDDVYAEAEDDYHRSGAARKGSTEWEKRWYERARRHGWTDEQARALVERIPEDTMPEDMRDEAEDVPDEDDYE